MRSTILNTTFIWHEKEVSSKSEFWKYGDIGIVIPISPYFQKGVSFLYSKSKLNTDYLYQMSKKLSEMQNTPLILKVSVVF